MIDMFVVSSPVVIYTKIALTHLQRSRVTTKREYISSL